MRSLLRILISGFAVLALAAPIGANAQNAGNTASLSCWEGHTRTNFRTRSAKTPVFKSAAGSAYAEVVAQASSGLGSAEFCKNNVQLFYARDGENYTVVFQKAGLEDQGVGIRIIGWSHSGKQLLIEIGVWGYDSDADVLRSALLFDSSTLQMKELPLGEAFEKTLGKDCEFESSLVRWASDDAILVRVTRTPPTARYEQTFCVEKPTLYSFNPLTSRLTQIRP